MKQLCIFLIALSITAHGIAQQPTWVWAHEDGYQNPNGFEEVTAMVSDLQGNTYVAGRFTGAIVIFGNDTIYKASSAVREGFIVKYNNAGNVIWAIGIHGTGEAFISSMVIDYATNLIVVGSMGAYSPGTYINIGTDSIFHYGMTWNDMFIFKLTGNGGFYWGRTHGSGGESSALAVTVNTLNEIYIAGYYSGWGLNFWGNSLPDATSQDMFIAHLDEGGYYIAAQAYPNDVGRESPSDMSLSPNGNIIVSGTYLWANYTLGNTTLPFPNNQRSDAFIASFSSGLAPQWAISGHGDDTETLSAISVDAVGHIYGAGNNYSTQMDIAGNTIYNVAGQGQIFLIKLDSNGNDLWSRAFGNPNMLDLVNDITIDALGNPTFTGICNSNTSFDNFNIPTSGSYVTRLDTNGIVVWAIGFGPSAFSKFCSNKYSNHLIISGSATGTVAFGPITVNATPNDIFIAQLDLTTGTIEPLVSSPPSVLPNPATDNVSFKLDPAKEWNLTITNAVGQVVLPQQVIIDEGQIDVSDLSGGIYFCTVIANDGTKFNNKLIIE